MKMPAGIRLIAAVLVAGALWDLFTTFYGLAGYFDLPLNPGVNPVQFTFGLVLTTIVFGFVIATHLIWTMKHDDLMVQLLKAAWMVCIAINLITSWQGTKHFVFYGDDGDAARGVGLALATALTVSSTIFLSRLVLGKDLTASSG
jgi:tryptophan-rich sensory protein